jgi:hypothetical protein
MSFRGAVWRGQIMADISGTGDALAMDDSAHPERDPAPESLRVPDPQMWEQPSARQALAEGDIGRIYRILQQDHGYDPAWIGALTGQSQPEVLATMQGRKVLALPRLANIAVGLGIPPGYLGLACCPCEHTHPAIAARGRTTPAAIPEDGPPAAQ